MKFKLSPLVRILACSCFATTTVRHLYWNLNLSNIQYFTEHVVVFRAPCHPPKCNSSSIIYIPWRWNRNNVILVYTSMTFYILFRSVLHMQFASFTKLFGDCLWCAFSVANLVSNKVLITVRSLFVLLWN